MKKSRQRKPLKPLYVYRIMFISSAVFFVYFFTVTLVSVIAPGWIPGNQYVHVALFSTLSMVSACGFSISLKVHNDLMRFNENLKVENQYTLGKPSTFYNLEAFKTRVRKARKQPRHRKMKQFLIVFTPTALEVASNRIRSNEMIELNNEIASFLTRTFEDEINDFYKVDNIYGFSRGIFLVYLFAPARELVQELVTTISNFIFRIVPESGMKIWAQPFYGVKELTEEDSLTSSIEDGLLARTISEANFESITFYSPALRKEVISGSDEITNALENDEFVPYFQLKYSLNERKFISAEALARWNSPKYGVLPPGKFIDKAERAGLLSAIDLDIFEKSVQCISDSLKRGRRIIPISVNFSLYEFFSRNFLDTIIGILQKYQVPPTYIEIEITETTSQSNKFLSLSVIKKLKDIGIRVLMDDFGVGFSQIGSLRQIPFDAIKIDKSFTDKILEDDKTRAIMKYLIELAHVNDMEAIVEGVESKEQVEALKKMHADTIQGYYYSKTISFKDFNDMLKSNDFERKERKK